MQFKVLLVSIVMLCSARLVYADCFEALGYDHDLYTIANKVALARVDGQTFSMLANENRPTPEEKIVILKWGEKRDACSKSLGQPNNPIAQISYEAFNASQTLILDLYKGSITYSQFAKQRQDIWNASEFKTQQFKQQYLQQAMQMQQYQQQQQQERQQQTQWQRQACLNRARNQFDVANCNMEAAGAGLGEAIINMSR